MTTTLGKPFLVKRFARECDGRCGGTIVLITDGSRWAYALTTDPQHGYTAQDNLVDLDLDNGVAAVGCQAVDGGERCDGGFEVSIETLAALPWQADEMTRWLEDVRR